MNKEKHWRTSKWNETEDDYPKRSAIQHNKDMFRVSL